MREPAENTFEEVRGELLALADDLAGLYGRRPERPLHTAGVSQGEDALLVVAVVGGKDVGKTTLINAVVGKEVAHERHALRGTEEITAYLHRDATGDCTRRLAGCGTVILHAHDRDPLRHLVLLDMPDFDSDFLDHLDVVLRSLPRLDRVLWLVSHEKYANRSMIELVRRCGQNPENFLFVINKLDLVAAAHGRDAATMMTRDFAEKLTRHLGGGNGNLRERVFGISAIRRDFDFKKLSENLTAVVGMSDIQRARSSNRAHALAADVKLLDETYRVAADISDLGEVGDLLGEQTRRLAAEWTEAAGAVLMQSPGLADEWGRQVFRVRIGAWPVLSLPFGPAVAVMGRLVGLRSGRIGGQGEPEVEAVVESILGGSGVQPVDAVSGCWGSIRQSRPGLAALLHVEPPYPWQPEACGEAVDRVRAALTGHLVDCRSDLLEGAGRSTRLGATIRWLMLLAPLIWFPLAQPILAASLETASHPGSLTAYMRLAYTAVTMLGATHWLKSLAVLAAVYGLIGLGVYARARRAVRRMLRKRLLRTMGPLIQECVDSSLRSPVDGRVEQLNQAQGRLERIRGCVR